MKTRKHHNNTGRRMTQTGSRTRRTAHLARAMKIPFIVMSKHATNVHDDTNNEREVISTYGDTAIVQHEWNKEEWKRCDDNDPRRGIRIDGFSYRFHAKIIQPRKMAGTEGEE